MNSMTTKIAELLILEPRVFEDNRGWFMESFNQERFDALLGERGFEAPHFVQDNHSHSQKGVLRGLHYQLNPCAQAKLVRVVQGRAWDVAVDIRQNSPTFGQWVGVELTATNHRQFWIPAGFAHGFVALEDDTQFLYKTTAYYQQDSERTIVWNDASLNIKWPIAGLALQFAEKDSNAASFAQAIKNNDVF